MSRCLPGLGLLCVALLLCSVSGDSGQGCCLSPIYERIYTYLGKNTTYAVAAILRPRIAEAPTNFNLRNEFPEEFLKGVAQDLNEGNRTHQSSHLVAARSDSQGNWRSAEHRLLEGGENSLMAQLIRFRRRDSTLVIFSHFTRENNRYEWKGYREDAREMQRYMGEFGEGHSSYGYTINGGGLAAAVVGIIQSGWIGSPYRFYVIIWYERLGSRYVFKKAADVVPDAGRN